MSNFIIFVVGLAVTLMVGMGIITGTVFLGYKNNMPKGKGMNYAKSNI